MYIKHSSIVISIGTELTDGLVQDVHLKFLAPYFKELGFQVIRGVQLPDFFGQVKAELEKAIDDCNILIITGGLGPTSDDITREIVAEIAGRELVFMDDLWVSMQQKFSGQKMAETNKKQAYIPENFTVLDNKWGTAPGFYGKIKNCLVFVLPGPPRELQPVFETGVLPVLTAAFPSGVINKELTASAFLIPESELEAGLQKCKIDGISWQTRLETDRIVFTVKCNAAGDITEYTETEGTIEIFYNRVENHFPRGLIRKGNKDCALILFEALLKKRKTIAFAESCTGGLLGKLITDIPGSSDVFYGGFIVYTNQLKNVLLGVQPDILEKYGAVSEEVVIALATGVIDKVKSHYSIAVSGVAGPGGGSPEKPVGTVWVCIAGENQMIKTWKYNFTGNRQRIRMKTAVAAFLNTESLILGIDNT